MKGKNAMEVMRMGVTHDLDILNPTEQDEILGGKNETSCQKGYSSFLIWESCDCGFKKSDDDSEEKEVPENPGTGPNN